MNSCSERRRLILDPDFIRGMRDVLEKACFTKDGIPERLYASEPLRITLKQMPRLLRLTAEGTPLDTLLRLFVFGVAVDINATEEALKPMSLQSWCEAGLLRCDDGEVASLVTLFPHNGFMLAYDRPMRLARSDMGPDFVPGPGSYSSILAYATIKRNVRSALDLGTGTGIQGMCCSKHSDRVVLTDINPRAVNLASFNVSLNGLENIEIREGNLFDAVRGETFDLITMNAPFAISPETRFIFRDGGMESDRFIQKVLREAPAFLAEDGYCQIAAQWAHIRGEDWKARIEGWLTGSGCDAWVINHETLRPDEYALFWISETDGAGTDAYRNRWEEWMAYFDNQGIEAVGSGIINMRRKTTGPNWFCVTEGVREIDGSAGEAIQRGFVLRDFLSRTSDDALLGTALRIAPDAVLQGSSRSNGKGWQIQGMTLRHTEGLRAVGNIDANAASLIGRFDGAVTLKQLIDEFAGHLGADPAGIQPSILAIVRALVENGFVLPPTLVDSGH
jgi:hypothetical protein